MGFDNENESKVPKKIVISDSRHSRDGSEALEQEPEVVEAAPEVVEPVAAQEPAPAPEPEPLTLNEPAPEQVGQAAPSEAPPQGEEMSPAQAAEMEQLKLIFGAGLKGYLGGQLGILINFALINLGRSPNPATGLVSPDPDNARLAIDLLELIVNGVKSEFPAEETANITKIVNELKFTFMQTMGNQAPPAEEPPAEG